MLLVPGVPPLPIGSRQVRALAYRRAASLCALVFAGTFAACASGEDDGTVVVTNDIPGLDSIMARNDSMLALPSRDALVLDSLKRDIDAQMRAASLTELPVKLPVAASAPSVSAQAGTIDLDDAYEPENSGRRMTERATARGDSMARADAQAMLAGSNAEARVRRDTARGVVTMVGGPSSPQMVLMASDGHTEITMSGMATTGMSRLAGAEIVVRGFKTSPRDVVVSDYIVRAMKGVPAYDGTLEQSEGAWVLVLTDGTGRKRLPSVPPALRALPGTRVWVTIRPGSDSPDAYGLIRR